MYSTLKKKKPAKRTRTIFQLCLTRPWGEQIYIYINIIVYEGKITRSWDPTEKKRKKAALRLLERNNGSWTLLRSYRFVRRKKKKRMK